MTLWKVGESPQEKKDGIKNGGDSLMGEKLVRWGVLGPPLAQKRKKRPFAINKTQKTKISQKGIQKQMDPA